MHPSLDPSDRAWQSLSPADPASAPVADRPRSGDNVYVLDPIELDPKPLKPDLPGSVVARASEDDLIDALTTDILLQARACVQRFGDFHLAVPSSPALNGPFRRLMYDPKYRSMPWKRTHLWQTDERCVAMDDPRRAWPRIWDLIVEPSDIPDLQAHPIAADDPGAEAEYERELTACLEWREKGHDRLDCVLLTLDARGGVAGLAPGPPTHDDAALVRRCASVRSSHPARPARPARPPSITMTHRLINASRFIAIWAVGDTLAPVLGRLESRTACEADLPAVGINPVGGELRWYVDRPACGG